MIEQITVFLFTTALIGGSFALCCAVTSWAMRTPRSGYLFTAAFLLYILARNLP